MIRLRYSPTSDVDLSGSLTELHDLRASILALLDSLAHEMTIETDGKFNPSPYEFRLRALSIKKGQGPVLVSITPEQVLQIKGAADNLRAFTSFLDFPPDDPFPSHIHYEYYPDNEWIAPGSLPLVLSIKKLQWITYRL
jgi:hypothetical protein